MIEDKFWLAINCYHEARGESIEGQVAVCHVVLNRAEKKKKSVKEIVLQPDQFSWHNGDAYPAIRDYTSLEKMCIVVEKVFEERSQGKTLSGADHYFADYIKTPSWAKNMKQVAIIGKHKFFKD